MDTMRAPHAHRLAVLLRAEHDGAEGAIEALEDDVPGILHRERERGVEHVGGREP